MLKFEVFKGKDGHFYFRLLDDAGKVILTSEGYVTKQGCMKGIDAVRRNSVVPRRFRAKESEDRKSYFILKAGNGEVIGRSGLFPNREARDRGISLMAESVGVAPVEVLK